MLPNNFFEIPMDYAILRAYLGHRISKHIGIEKI